MRNGLERNGEACGMHIDAEPGEWGPWVRKGSHQVLHMNSQFTLLSGIVRDNASQSASAAATLC